MTLVTLASLFFKVYKNDAISLIKQRRTFALTITVLLLMLILSDYFLLLGYQGLCR